MTKIDKIGIKSKKVIKPQRKTSASVNFTQKIEEPHRYQRSKVSTTKGRSNLSASQSMAGLHQLSIKQVNDMRLENLKARIIDTDFWVRNDDRKRKRKVMKKVASKAAIRERVKSSTRPISPVLKSNNIMARTQQRYHVSVKHMMAPKVVEPPKKNHYYEDVADTDLFINPFIDLSRPFNHHLDIPDDVIEAALGQDLKSTMRSRRKLSGPSSLASFPKRYVFKLSTKTLTYYIDLKQNTLMKLNYLIMKRITIGSKIFKGLKQKSLPRRGKTKIHI